MANTGEGPARQRRVMETMREHGAAGYILCPAMGTNSGQTAALSFSDVVAFGALDALAAAGLTVGRDFSLIDFDDVAGARHTLPPLTTVAVYPRELGRRSAAALLRRIADPSEPPERSEYCISKAGLAMMTKLLALRLADEGISVFEIRPGSVVHVDGGLSIQRL